MRAIEVEVATDEVDLASGLLWVAGVAAVAEHPAASGRTRLRVDVPAGGVAAVEGALDGRWAVHLVTVADDGLDAWRTHAQVVRAGRRLVVRPPWVPLGPVAEDAVVLEIDPGPSFGHGAHPTTRLCLAALEALLDPPTPSALGGPTAVGAPSGGGPSVLDVGCGSGVLAVAAAVLGAERVVAVDVSPAAVDATSANAARNRVGARIDARLVAGEDDADPLAGVPGDAPFDLVVANLGAAALVALAPHLVAQLGEGGRLVISGLLDPPPPRVAAAFAPLAVVDRAADAGWTALVLAPT